MSVATTEGNSVGSELFGGTAHAAEATWFVCLFTASPTVAGLGDNEVTGGGYARVSMTNNATNFPATASLVGANGVAVAFPTVTSGGYSGTVTHFGLADSTTESADDIKYYGALDTPFIAVVGQIPTFAIGALRWSFA